MKERQAEPKAAKPRKDWQKTPFANLIRYVPSGTYYARLRVKRKLVRKTLKTDVLSVAKLRLGDFEKLEHQRAEPGDAAARGKITLAISDGRVFQRAGRVDDDSVDAEARSVRTLPHDKNTDPCSGARSRAL